jgi:hypothetical protein
VLHLGDLARVPNKLAIWGTALPAAALGQSTTERVQALVDSLRRQACQRSTGGAASDPLNSHR